MTELSFIIEKKYLDSCLEFLGKFPHFSVNSQELKTKDYEITISCNSDVTAQTALQIGLTLGRVQKVYDMEESLQGRIQNFIKNIS